MKKDPGRYINEKDVEGRLKKELRRQDDLTNRGKTLFFGIIAGITVFILWWVVSWLFSG